MKTYLKEITNQSLPVNSYYISFNDYKIVEIEKNKYIVGIGKPIINDSSDEKNKIYDTGLKTVYISAFDNFDLFFSLYNLVNKKEENYNNWSKENLQKIIPDNKILKWIKKYGLPYQENKTMKLVRKEGFILGIDLFIFKRRILDLYFSFELWEAYFQQNQQRINKLELFFIRPDEKIAADYEKNRTIVYNKMLKYLIASGINILPEYKGNNNFELIIETCDLYSAACFEFYCLLTKDREKEVDGVGEGNLKTCSLCGNRFWTKETKREFCPPEEPGKQSKCRKKAATRRKKEAKNLWNNGYSANEVFKKLNEVSDLKNIKKWFEEWEDHKEKAKLLYKSGSSIDEIYQKFDKNKILKSDIIHWFKEWEDK